MKKNFYSKEFKEGAVKLVLQEELSSKQAAKELGISQSAMRKWVKEAQANGAGAFPGSGRLNPADQKTRDLEKKVRRLEMERDILKKAAAYFAREHL